tara:strand:+ start:59 stop:439 length:381 start_codon:yes stop_codon:yes gene_type:complete
MANPNIINATSILGKTVYSAGIAVSATELLENAASSSKVFKINSLIIANIDTAATPQSANITVTIRNANGTIIYSTLAKDIAVPAYATLVVISKDTSIYLEEDRSIWVAASVAGDLSATCSYEEIT